MISGLESNWEESVGYTTLMEACINAEYLYLHEVLPERLNQIKLNRYENLHSTKDVPDTESEGST